MTRTILVCGYGPGISHSVARVFGNAGFSVGLVGRNAERLAAGVHALEAEGLRVQPFPCDLSIPDAVTTLVRSARNALGPLSVLHWNAYAGHARDLMQASTDDLRGVFDVTVHGLLAAVREGLHDLKQQKGAVLVTGGGLGLADPQADARAVEWNAMGLALGKAAQHKLVGLLHRKLASSDVYVGEVTVLSIVKRSALDAGQATLEPARVAEAFWALYQRRTGVSATIA